ncbi:hypothetical protein Gogos_021772 [Gossypium gossypioides]|uniref:Uncharacterized protein n=1 Tax=Gossypium gossypioides TaxID=34282 RepID=A0A7J9CXJ4_GOSGO|nr:hypothetical protein [Gossypium gossypioides]
MGIDPNNHRLITHNHLPRPHDSNSGASIISPASKVPVTENTNIHPPEKSRGDNDQVSDAASSLEDHKLPDLNLDLTISVSASTVDKVKDDRRKSQKQSNIIEDP